MKSHDVSQFGYHQQLNRSLNFWQLLAFGLNYMIPIAPAIVFGLILTTSGGSVALPYLFAGIGMSFTAISYGILIKRFPIAGSVYSYIGRCWNPSLGFVTGWVLLLDYLLIPTVTSMSAVIYIQNFFPDIPYPILLLIFVGATGLLNLFDVRLMAKLGVWMLIIGEIVIFLGFFVWSYAVSAKSIGTASLISIKPLEFHDFSALAAATSIAVLSYLGFDAITTLAEEAENPVRDIPKAIFWSVIIGGATMFLTGYLGMLAIPNWHHFIHDENWINSTLFYVASITGGQYFEWFYVSGFVLAMAVFNVVATSAGARLLFGMGRDNTIPTLFASVNKRWKTPHWSIAIITISEFLLGVTFNLNDITELVNYGALLAFIVLNLCVFLSYIFVSEKLGITKKTLSKEWFRYIVSPVLGCMVLLLVFIHMQLITLIIGSAWLLMGIIFLFFYNKKAVAVIS